MRAHDAKYLHNCHDSYILRLLQMTPMQGIRLYNTSFWKALSFKRNIDKELYKNEQTAAIIGFLCIDNYSNVSSTSDTRKYAQDTSFDLIHAILGPVGTLWNDGSFGCMEICV